ncbi:MAG: 4Fe-4S binding protein [Planctomycetales bacterium]|nr:4Fe-4S binding protein [Planctomycetales bacterium]
MADYFLICGTVLTIVALATLFFVVFTRFISGRSAAILRLDWYMPTLRKLKADQRPSPSLLGSWLRRVLPGSWQSDWQTKRRGKLRQLLRRMGISWLASPVRRLSQTACLITFLLLFLYVCWPYNAVPSSASMIADGWVFNSIDQDSGDLLFTLAEPAAEKIETGRTLFAYSSGSVMAANPQEQRLGQFEVVEADTAVNQTDLPTLRLRFVGSLASLDLQRLLTSSDSYIFFDRELDAWPTHYADNLANKEFLPAEFFLTIDPLVSLSTAIASRSWVWSLASAGAILVVCWLIPRGFCGYLCPLGTTIDLFDWLFCSRVRRFRVPDNGWWVHIKYYLLAGVLVAATCGVLLSGAVAAIPVITRAMLFLVDPLQNGLGRSWHLVPAWNWGHALSLALFATVLCLGYLRPRFWCKYVCPSGAVFSLGNLLRLSERKVEASCIHCNKCVEICPFDAIKPDFTTRATDCTLCQSCAGVCPTHAIKFVERWNVVELKVADDPPTKETALGRRGFLSLAAGSTAAAVGGLAIAGATKAWGANLADPNAFRPVRPPGSVPEKEFLEMCIRCGECFKACPNNVLQPEGFEQGFEGIWSPMVNANWAGCESSCNACGQVCPTGAIRALPMEEKKVARMGLAFVDESTCLPVAGKEDCDLCVQECLAAGYQAIEYRQVGTQVDEAGQPIEGSGFLAPAVLADRCVGCGLCQTRCYAINVKQRHVLSESAIIIRAGEGYEDRMMEGSYIQRRAEEAAARRESQVDASRPESANPPPIDQIDAPTPPGQIFDDVDPFGLDTSPEADSTGQFDEVDPFGLNN